MLGVGRLRVGRVVAGVRAYSVKLMSEGPWRHSEVLSGHQSRKLDATLNGHLPEATNYIKRGPGAEVPPGYHLAYFNPLNPESELSSDGYGNFQSPGPKYPNRMWLGGTIEYNVETALVFGEPATCVETVADIKESSKSKGERVSVTLDRVMRNDGDTHKWSVRERRTLIYFSESSGLSRDSTFDRFITPPENPTHRHTFRPSTVTLFRYSALTFNSHRIHYDPLYAQDVEKFPGLVVHGPFTVTTLLRWVTGTLLGSSERRINTFTYRNLLPLFVDQEMTLCARVDAADTIEVWIENHRGSQALSGTMYLN